MTDRHSDAELLRMAAEAHDLGQRLNAVLDELMSRLAARLQAADGGEYDAAVRALTEAQSLGHDHRATGG